MKFSDVEEVITKEELKAKAKQDKKHKKTLLQKIDLGKRFPNHIDKKIIRAGFIVVLVIQVIALMQTGFNFNPVWVECNKDVCSNPFFEATGELCDITPNLCTVPILNKGEVIGSKPPAFARSANFLSWLALIAASVVNYKVCKKRRLA